MRAVTARTRNLRLTAIHSFFRYVAFEGPTHAAQTQGVSALQGGRSRRLFTLSMKDLADWRSNRADAGRIAPKDLPRPNMFIQRRFISAAGRRVP
jgi:hypothetical protein